MWKSRWRIRDLLADGRCSQAVLDFLSTIYRCGRLVPAEEDARSEVSEGAGRGEEGGGGGTGCQGGTTAVPTHAFFYGIRR